jgi:hypothetical protein
MASTSSNASNEANLVRFENKDMPREAPPTKIVEAYGLRKCPKLVSQICASDLDIRINALAVLCDEFKNPYSIEGCVREGVITVLAAMITDPDYTTRVRATCALHLAALDANGFSAILKYQNEVFPKLVEGVYDPSEVVRENVYKCVLATTRSAEGVEACVANNVTRAFVEVLSGEIEELQPFLLKTLHNVVGSENGLLEALDAKAVPALIALLDANKVNTSTQAAIVMGEAARALGFMCYDGRAKKETLELGAVEKLIDILLIKTISTSLKMYVTIALMAITITNEGKIKVFNCNGLDAIMPLLYDDSAMVVVNTLKIMSNLAVYPKSREAFISDSTCAVKLRKLTKSEDQLIAKHAGIALAAVNWTP